MVATCHQSLPWLFVVLLLLSQSSFTDTLRWSLTHTGGARTTDASLSPPSHLSLFNRSHLPPSSLPPSLTLFFSSSSSLYKIVSSGGLPSDRRLVFPWWATFGCDTVRLERHLVETVQTLQAADQSAYNQSFLIPPPSPRLILSLSSTKEEADRGEEME